MTLDLPGTCMHIPQDLYSVIQAQKKYLDFEQQGSSWRGRSLSLAPIVATNGHFVLTSASIGQFGCMQDLVSVTVETTAFVSTHVSVTAIENTSFNRASSFLVPLLRFMLKRIK